MFYIFLLLYLCTCIYYYKIIIFNIVVKYNKQLVDVSAIEVLHYYCYCCCYHHHHHCCYYYYYYYYAEEWDASVVVALSLFGPRYDYVCVSPVLWYLPSLPTLPFLQYRQRFLFTTLETRRKTIGINQG